VKRVRLLFGGRSVSRTVRRVSLARPITMRYLRTPDVPVPKPPPFRLPAPDAATLQAQKRLIRIGFLVAGDADGRYAKIPRWWSTPFREWLPWALPFVGGIAFHQYAIVPAYPASHGCVRQSFAVARSTYDFARVGMPVRVLARS
jgi:L,D-transpeptidase catalytic domain